MIIRFYRRAFQIWLYMTGLFVLSAAIPIEARFDLPDPPGASLYSRETISADRIRLEFREFQMPDSGPAPIGRQRAEVYIEQLRAAGWELIQERWRSKGGEFVLRKDLFDVDILIAMGSKGMEGRKTPYVSYRAHVERRIPSVDILGCDPLDVPRYPGSVRLRWMNLMGDFSARFQVAARLDDVSKFFEKTVPEQGWTCYEKEGGFHFRKGGIEAGERLESGELSKDPVHTVGKLIPTTLTVKLGEKDGIVDIRWSRTAGGADEGKGVAVTALNPELKPGADESNSDFRCSIDDMPVYPGLELKSEKDLDNNAWGEHRARAAYQTEPVPRKEALRIADFYLREMAARGWRLTNDDWVELRRRLTFRQAGAEAEIYVQALGRLENAESRSPARIPVQIELRRPMPDRERAGRDIPDVPRYPGSVRYMTLEKGISHMVRYKAAGSREAVMRYYTRTLPGKGWKLAGHDSTGLLFVPVSTASSGSQAFSKGNLVPTTLRILITSRGTPFVRIQIDQTKGD